jgi:hypothetical protein
MTTSRTDPSDATLVGWCEEFLDLEGNVKGSFSHNTAKVAAFDIMQLRDPWSDPEERRSFFGTIARLAAQAFIDSFDALKQTRRAAKKAFKGSTSRPALPLGDLRLMLDSAQRVPATASTTGIVLYVGFCALARIQPDGAVDSLIQTLDEPRQLAVRQARDWGFAFHGDEQAYARLVADSMSMDTAPWGPYRRASAFLGLLAAGWWRPELRPTREMIESVARSEPELLTLMLRSLDAWQRG